MKRKDFLRRALLGLGVASTVPSALLASSENSSSTPVAPEEAAAVPTGFEQVGFEHLPHTNNEQGTMEQIMGSFVLHKADTRGFADHGWLRARHTFSFANYYHPERVHFGALRVLNDDEIAGGRGFGMHPHDNMEIVTIPLTGDLEHKDSMGNSAIIRQGDVQIMSAGTGVRHSEWNPRDSWTTLLQIWIFPDKKNIQPRYDQKTFGVEGRRNKYQTVVSPRHEGAMWINQDAYISLARLDSGKSLPYALHTPVKNGVYLFLISGSLQVGTQTLEKRDAIGIWEMPTIPIKALSDDTEFVILEIPMQVQ